MEAVLFSKRDTARMLSVSLRTVDDLISRGELSIHRIGRRVLISRTAIESFVRQSSRPGRNTSKTQKAAVATIVLLLALFVPGIARAQTVISATGITDKNGNAYTGTITPFQVVATGQPQQFYSPVPLNSSGAFSTTVQSNVSYTFTVTSAPTPIGPLTNVTPKLVPFTTTPILISGASQDLTAFLQAAASAAPILGPAATATALQNPPTQCASGVATGIAANGNANCTNSPTFSGQVSSTVTTGTAPFSIASTTVVQNLNSQLHNGKTAPSGNIVGDTDSQTLQNKTLTSASNGNTVTLLCSSGPAAAITGNSSAQTFFGCTIPANAVANLKGLRVTLVWSHSTGTAVISYGLTLNGVACWPSNNTASTVGGLSQIANFIETGSTTGNVMTQQGFFSFTTTSLTGLAWTSGQTLAATFSVANTDQITPLFFLVELIQ